MSIELVIVNVVVFVFIFGCTYYAVRLSERKLQTVSDKAYKLESFKDYVHQRLTEMGVPENPDPKRTEQTGCRVGSRLNWVEVRLTDSDSDRCKSLEDYI